MFDMGQRNQTFGKSSGRLEAKMTPEQIEALAVMIASNLPALLRRRPYKGSKKPNKLRNPENVYVELDDVRLIIRAALNQK
jgi:hypothetical protein